MVEFGQRRRLTTEADPQMRSVECGRKGAGDFCLGFERGIERRRRRREREREEERT